MYRFTLGREYLYRDIKEDIYMDQKNQKETWNIETQRKEDKEDNLISVEIKVSVNKESKAQRK